VATAVGTETLDIPDAAVPQLIVVVVIVAAFALLKKLLSLKDVTIGVEITRVVERKRLINLFLFTFFNSFSPI
jgi:uncharacterized membrane protein